MKIAYCIVCHKYTPVLRELVGLVGPRNEVYVHVDAKADIASFGPIADMVNFVEPRVKVSWGTYSQVEATLRLLDATEKSDCDYIALISGDTLPLRSDQEIKRYLWANRGREFIYELPLQAHHIDRVRYKYPDCDMRGRSFAAKAWYGVRKRLRLLPRNKWFGALPPLAFGSNWFVITPDFRNWMFSFLGSNPEFTEAFRHGHCGDELFFATLINNSPFAAKRDPRRYMYVDWETGPQYPRTLDGSDFDRLREAVAMDDENGYFLFARKFSDALDLNAYRTQIMGEIPKKYGR